ncbi:MAG TPA: alpha/beta hydrolase-fold protein [Bryobacteraceae bacterium]|nr:alpha/beta hydrolase-fold protein [Bryobacteraceae bacterium]
MKLSAAILLSLGALAQPPPPVMSPEAHADGRVTFRFRAPNAKDVLLARDGASRVPMRQDEQGVWSITTEALEPDFYGYTFVADGVSLLDPMNPRMKPNLLNTQSVVHVPGPASLVWELGSSAPRGTVHRHFYRSAVVGDDRDFYVYTPPGYDPTAHRTYPVLYLLHGFSDDASGWTAVGRANVILDNLIAQRKAKPMLIVMPLGYGAPEIVSRTPGPGRAGLRQRSFDKFREALFTEVIPEVEKSYRVAKDRTARAIAGLSMGGAESLYTGLNAVDRFAWIGAFSSGGMGDDLEKSFAHLDAKAGAQLRLLWIACGKEDRLIESNRKLLDFLQSRGVRYTWRETPGAHTWLVWRRYLAEFAPLLFQDKTS